MNCLLDDDELEALERVAADCPDACASDVVRLAAVVRRLRDALQPFADHSLPGWDRESGRRYRIRVTEGQVARAWMALND